MTWRLTTAERRANAKKAALTRKRKGEKPFGAKQGHGRHLTPAERVAAAKRALATKRARGEKLGFAALSPTKRHEMALKAAETRRERHER